MRSDPRSRYRSRPSYRGNPIIAARLGLDDWRAVHDYADEHGITISDVAREAFRLMGVIQGVNRRITTLGEMGGSPRLSEAPSGPVTRSPTAPPLTFADAIEARLYDKAPLATGIPRAGRPSPDAPPSPRPGFGLLRDLPPPR